MKDLVKQIAIFAIVALIGVVLVVYMRHSRQELKRLRTNQEALLDSTNYYRTEAGRAAASVKVLELSKSEIEKHCERLAASVEDMAVKLKRAESVASTATATKVYVQTEVHDTIIHRDTAYIRAQAISWWDPWVSVTGQVYENRKVDLQIQSTDTLYQVVHRVPKRFLFFRWGTKRLEQVIASSNPHTIITYSEFIKVR